MKRILAAVCLCLAAGWTIHLPAQVNPYKDPTPGVSGYRGEVLAEVRIQESKFTRLAEAIPADKYTWRPAPEVRSIAEVFLHVSTANYNLYKLVGTPPPAGLDLRALEKSTTDKAKVLTTLKDSFEHAKKTIAAMPDADLEKSLDWFGGKNTQRGILLFITRHAAEHLGQSIAYARSIGVVPPWTTDFQREQQQQRKPPAANKQFFNPEGLSKPPGYTHAISVQGGWLVLIAGQVALDAGGQVVGKDDFHAQAQQAFENLKTALAAAGATPADIVKVNYYVVNYSAERHLAPLREVRSRFLPLENPPASTLIGVQALARPDFMIEIEALAAVP
jgi:2-iminobutanoate/2-iminopropanoate deaminase